MCNAIKKTPESVMDSANIRYALCAADPAAPSLTARIAAFLDGRTYGEELLHALYDHVLDEPLPLRMRALLPK